MVANLITMILVLITSVVLLAFAVARRLSINLVVASDITLRAVEMMYCLVILGVYRSRLLAHSSSNTSKNSNFTPATSKIEITENITRRGTDAGVPTKSATSAGEDEIVYNRRFSELKCIIIIKVYFI